MNLWKPPVTVNCRICGFPFEVKKIIQTRGRYCCDCKKRIAREERAAAKAAMGPLERIGFIAILTDSQRARIKAGTGSLRDRVGIPMKRSDG